jgi:three-Cys-motif partner protein
VVDEPVIFPPKKIPTQVKHWILARCLSGWGGIIIASNLREVRLCFVDTCCGSGLYTSADKQEAAEGIYESGSALIGPQALAELRDHAKQRNRPVKTRALLINADAKELDTAQRVISSAGLDKNVDDVRFEAHQLEDVQQIITQYTDEWFSFVFIDPYGPKPTPFSVVADIVQGQYTDTLINFPFYSFQKWTGFLGKTPSGDQQAKLAAADAFMGGQQWRDVARAAKAAGPLEQALVDHYLQRLESLGVFALALPLMFEDKNRVMYHLIFTSHNVAGLASAKEKFQAGEDHQYKLRQELETQRTKMRFLFDTPIGSEEAVDIDGLANSLGELFRGRTVTFERIVLAGLRMKRVLEPDVRKALTRLKAHERIQRKDTKSLKYKDGITFVASSARKNR